MSKAVNNSGIEVNIPIPVLLLLVSLGFIGGAGVGYINSQQDDFSLVFSPHNQSVTIERRFSKESERLIEESDDLRQRVFRLGLSKQDNTAYAAIRSQVIKDFKKRCIENGKIRQDNGAGWIVLSGGGQTTYQSSSYCE